MRCPSESLIPSSTSSGTASKHIADQLDGECRGSPSWALFELHPSEEYGVDELIASGLSYR